MLAVGYWFGFQVFIPFRPAAGYQGTSEARYLPQHPILSYIPDLVERMVAFSLSEFETLPCIPHFSFGVDGTADKARLGVSVSQIER